jgi:alpha-1,3-rhamnosyl/mannosyltransferase
MIISLGYVRDAELSNLYNGAALFVFPSTYEGFGFPPLEAMACGVPTIVSSGGSLSEVIGNGGIVISPKDIDAMSIEIERLLETPGKREVFSKRGMERAKMFTWSSCAEKTFELYKSVCQNQGG